MILYLNTCGPSPGDGGTRFYKYAARGNLVRETFSELEGPSKHLSGRVTADRNLEICTVSAKKGRCLIFYHNLLHEGTPPASGSTKYIIRSDVMFRRRHPICVEGKDLEAFELYRQAVDLAGTRGKEADAVPLFRRAFRLSRSLSDLYGM